MAAQKSIKVTYEALRKYPESLLTRLSLEQRLALEIAAKNPYLATMINNGDESLYQSIIREDDSISGKRSDSKTDIDKGLVIKTPKYWRLKEFSSKTQINLSVIDNQEYYLNKQIEEPKLYFTNDEIVIDKYVCKYAYSINPKSNDTIKYWYTSQIPIDDCPSNVSGFPGIVLKMETKNSLEYATKIEFFAEKLVIDRPKKSYQITTQEEINKLIFEAKKPKNYVDQEGKTITTETIRP